MELNKATPASQDGLRQSRFEAVLREERDSVFRYCARLCSGRTSEAEDLAQETWLQVWRSLDQFQGRSDVRRWIFKIALRKWLARRKASEVGLAGLSPEDEPRTDPIAAIELRLALSEALGRLSEPLRVALILVKCEGLTHREAAEVLGVPHGTVQFRVFTAVHRLRRLLKEGGIVLSVFQVGRLDGPLREWTNVSAPAGHHDRMLEAVRLDQPDQRVPPTRECTGSLGRRLPLRPAPLIAAVGVALIGGGAGLVVLQRFRSGPPLRPAAAAADQMLQVMQRVQTARATGTSQNFGEDGRGGELNRITYWFRQPGSYRLREQSLTRGRLLVSDIYLERDRAVLRTERPGSPTRALAIDGISAGTSMAPFAFFAPDSTFARRIREQPDLLVREPAEAGGAGATLYSWEGRIGRTRERWRVFRDPLTGRVARVVTESFTPARSGWRLARRLELDRFEYGIEIPAAELRSPRAVTGAWTVSSR